MAVSVNVNVRIRTRYIGWALFVLRIASALWRVPGGKRLARLVYGACWFQFRCEAPKITVTRWHWLRVPFPDGEPTHESEQV